ncbi:MAG: S1C family serine protease [Herbinix sp.]|nr:S1C family serine protease [Herbinix sp.]
MSANEKDNNNFEFIKEQVIEKKRKKIKKMLYPPMKTISLAILFGITAAITFTVAETKLNKFMNKEEETGTPVSFPTECPQNTNNASEAQECDTGVVVTETPDPEPIILEQSIAADLDDYLSMNNDIREVAHNVNKSILNIKSKFYVKDLFGKTVTKTINTTGVIVYNNTKDLLVLVSLDRVKDAKSIKIVFADSVAVDAVLQEYDSEINLALIAVAIEDIPETYKNSLQTATLGESYSVTVGSPIIALGSPNGHSNSMEIGMVTSKGSIANITDNRLDLFNTNILDNKSSDGIIVNMDGKVVGIITRTLKEDENEDLNTVIGISKLLPIIEEMGNKEPRVYFGVKADDITDDVKQEHNITNGIYIKEVLADSPAFDAGVQNGDIILEVNESTILSSSNFYDTITEYQPGDKINVKISRTNGTKDIEIVLSVLLIEKVN